MRSRDASGQSRGTEFSVKDKKLPVTLPAKVGFIWVSQGIAIQDKQARAKPEASLGDKEEVGFFKEKRGKLGRLL